MEQLSETLRLFMVVIGLVQIILSFGAWYLGLQLKMLRLELMSKKECEEKHAKVKEELSTLHLQSVETAAKVGAHLTKGGV